MLLIIFWPFVIFPFQHVSKFLLSCLCPSIFFTFLCDSSPHSFFSLSPKPVFAFFIFSSLHLLLHIYHFSSLPLDSSFPGPPSSQCIFSFPFFFPNSFVTSLCLLHICPSSSSLQVSFTPLLLLIISPLSNYFLQI